MMTPDEVRSALQDRNLQKVAEASKVSPATIYRFMQSSSRPTYETVKALSDYLESRNDKPA
jgi:DNA-binding phage protein